MTTTQANDHLIKGWAATVDADGERGDGSEVELPALSERSDAWLVGRARELLPTATTGELDERHRRTEELDALLAEAQHRGEPRMVAQLLRAAILIRRADGAQADSAE